MPTLNEINNRARLYAEQKMEKRQARQRAERHMAYRNCALWVIVVCVLLVLVKFIVDRGAL